MPPTTSPDAKAAAQRKRARRRAARTLAFQDHHRMAYGPRETLREGVLADCMVSTHDEDDIDGEFALRLFDVSEPSVRLEVYASELPVLRRAIEAGLFDALENEQITDHLELSRAQIALGIRDLSREPLENQ